MGTDPSRACAATAAPKDEPGLGAWPVDFNNDQKVDLSDVMAYRARFGIKSSDARYSPRIDLNADGAIGIGDIIALVPFFGMRCSP
jgi:hypothetical protein